MLKHTVLSAKEFLRRPGTCIAI